VLKNSLSLMIENSQRRWCASLASMRGATSITAKTRTGARIDLQSLAVAEFA
jgi:hypothetical protein